MIILQAEDLSISYGGQKVLDKISLAINERERVGLVGVNGSGKTTLLKCLTKQIALDSGKIYISAQTTYEYLEQLPEFNQESTLWDVVMDSFAELLGMRNELRELERLISTANEEELTKLMEKYARVTEEYERNDGYLCENTATKILIGLGFKEDEFKRKINSLSGGERTRLNMARLLALEPDILFLDEPTNHLDMAAVEWLEEYLSTYKGTVVVVSHDRLFLDKIATRILEISHTKIYSYPGNYSNYLKLKAVNSLAWEKAYQKQLAYIRKTEAYIERFKAGIKAKQAHGRKQQLDRLERLEKIEPEKSIALWEFELKQTSSTDVLKVENVAKSYDKLLFNKVNIHIRKGDKVAIVGPNGCGKTTLLKIILGQISPDEGNVHIGSRVISGYFSQEFADLDEQKTVLDEIIYNFDITIEKARTLLGRMLFTGDDILKNVKDLSGGEKARVAILKLLLTGANFLILDEPTNHLDIESRLVVEDILADYPGTILLVSHDRYFIDQVANQLLVFENNTIVNYLGNYSYYQAKKTEELDKVESKAKIEPSTQQLLRIEQKEKEKMERRVKRNLVSLEDEINTKETEINIIENELANPEIYADVNKVQPLSQELDKLQIELLDLYEKWDELINYAENNRISI